jgi:hypothetical protein
MRSFFLHSGLTGLVKLLTEKKIAIAGILYLLFSFCTLWWYGIDTNGEALKYLDDAHRILNGQVLRMPFFSIFYILYSLLVAFCIKFSLSLQVVAVVQVLLSFIAACCLYKLLLSITSDGSIAGAGFVIYLLCFPVQKWNFFLYTESLHTSLTVICLYVFYSIIAKGQSTRWWIYLLLLLLIIFSRPVGIIFITATFFTVITWLIKKRKKTIYYPVILSLAVLVVLVLESPFVFYFNPDSLRRMEVICQVPGTTSTTPYQEYNSAGLSSFFHVIFSEIGIKKFLLTGARKLGSFFGMMRSFYSMRQNIVLLVTGVLLYPLAIAGIFYSKNTAGSYIKLFSILYILITAGGIFFTCDEWSNRFIAPVLPQVILLGGMGLSFIKSAFANLRRDSIRT